MIIGFLVGCAFWWIPLALGIFAGYGLRLDEEKKGIKPCTGWEDKEKK